MLKVTVNERVTEVAAQGEMIDILDDISTLINTVWRAVNAHDEGDGEMMKMLLQAAVTDESGPVWRNREAPESVTVVTYPRA